MLLSSTMTVEPPEKLKLAPGVGEVHGMLQPSATKMPSIGPFPLRVPSPVYVWVPLTPSLAPPLRTTAGVSVGLAILVVAPSDSTSWDGAVHVVPKGQTRGSLGRRARLWASSSK